MIYVFANTAIDATRYSVHARLKGVKYVNSVDEEVTLHEDDEVFVLKNSSKELKMKANREYGKVFPRPHLFREVEPVKTH